MSWGKLRFVAHNTLHVLGSHLCSGTPQLVYGSNILEKSTLGVAKATYPKKNVVGLGFFLLRILMCQISVSDSVDEAKSNKKKMFVE